MSASQPDERIEQVAGKIIECDAAIAYDDEYEGLTGSFARACRLADAEHARKKQIVAQREHHVPSSTLMAMHDHPSNTPMQAELKWLDMSTGP
jgi:hypothetical protein